MAKEKPGNGSGNATLALSGQPDSAMVVQGPATLAMLDNADPLALYDAEGGITIEDDGLGQVGREDIKLSTKVFNFKGTQANGDPILPNTFYDTLTESIDRELDVIMLKLHKTNEWREYDEAQKKNNVMCRSWDRYEGVMADGTVRKCEGCPDAQWSTILKDGRPKRTRRCGSVHNIFMVQLPTFTPCVIRFRRTSLRPIQDHISRHHWKNRRVKDPKTGSVDLQNTPLYTFFAKLSLKMSEDRQPYAIPVITKGAQLPLELFRQAMDTVTYVNSALMPELNKIVDAAEVGGEDTSFDTDAMGGNGAAAADTGGGEGQDFAS